MPVYGYIAKNAIGQTMKGTYETGSTNLVYSMLKQKGFYPTQITLSKNQNKSKATSNVFEKKVKTRDLAVFTRQFGSILHAGVPVVKCLDILRKQVENPILSVVLDKVYQSVQKGSMLSEAMREHKKVFSTLYISMIQTGEVSGTLDNSLDKLANQFEKEYKLNQKIKGAMTYPIILVSICMIAVVVLLGFVVPQFSEVFSGMGVELPAATKMLLNISNIIKGYWYILIILVVGSIFGVIYFVNSPKGKAILDDLWFKLPVISQVMRKTIAARFARALATMLNAGVPLIKALEISEKAVENTQAIKCLKKVQEEVSRGSGLSGPLAQFPIFPPMLSQMTSIGEESGSLDTMLEKTADYYEDEADVAISQLTTLLEPLILVVMAVLVAAIVIPIVIPMLSLGNSIK